MSTRRRPLPLLLVALAACTTPDEQPATTATGDPSSSTDSPGDTDSPTTDPASACGDGVVQTPGEECDDGDHDNNDLCLDTCERASCGDGFVQLLVEICDDGEETPTCDGDCSTAACGDGHVNPAAGEVCDDGNNVGQDGCEPNCDTTEPPPSKFVFVTSQRFTADFGGLAGADAKCQAAAASAGLPGTYMAWLSDDTGSPATRMSRSAGAYVLPDGTEVAHNWTALTFVPTKLSHPLDMTETMGTPPDGIGPCDPPCPFVWTNTREAGVPVPDGTPCANWTATTGQGAWGNWHATDAFWTWMSTGDCSAELPLYCFQQ